MTEGAPTPTDAAANGTEPSDEQTLRDQAIEALLPLVPQRGWTVAALREAAGADADLLFPALSTDGPAALAAAHSDMADRRMLAAAANAGLAGLRLPDRVRAVIAIRLRQNRDHKAAIQRGLRLLASPGHGRLALRSLARTVDAIWFAAGDRSADFSWYTKRAILASIYSATLLRWVNDADAEDDASLAFLDRRLADVARFGRLKRRFAKPAQTAA